MDLFVCHSTDPSPIPTCFAALPTPIAASLSNLRPFSSLVVLKLIPSSPSSPIYIAWSAATTPHPNSLVLHPLFAAAIPLLENTTVSATVAERVIGTPRTIVRTATLRPTSYDLCLQDAGTDASSHAYSLAMAEFTTLSASASVLERSLLEQIRVVQEGLCFPLRLPAKDTIHVRIVALETSHNTSVDYAILQPDSEIHVQPPPLHPRAQHSQSLGRLQLFLRVLPPSKLPSTSDSRPIFATHVMLPEEEGCAAVAFRRARYALISRKRGKGVAIPVAFLFDPSVPSGHVAAPPAVWKALALSSFMPVFIDEVPPFAKSDGNVQGERIDVAYFQSFAAWDEVREKGGVYFDEMCVKGGIVRVRNGKKGMKAMITDIWDAVGLKEREIADGDVVDNRFAMESESRSNLIRIAQANREVREGFRSFPEQALKFSEEDGTNALNHNESFKCYNGRPLRREETKCHALLSLTKSGRDAIDTVVKTARNLFCKQKRFYYKQRNCKTVVLEGPIGSGKTHVSKAIAALLRELASARTIWIRGKVHAGEQKEILEARIKRAFEEASDGGPGIVVVDDIDMFLGNRKSHKSDTEVHDPGEERGRQSLSQMIEGEIRKLHPNPVLLIISCEKATEMELNLRSPSIFNALVQLSLPTPSERALLYWTALQNLNLRPPTGENLQHIRKEVASLGFLTDGYSPKDIEICMKRTRIAMDVHPIGNDLEDLSQVIPILKTVLKKMTPGGRAGITFSEPTEGQTFSWSQIGGLQRAKNALWQVLQLPSARPDVFSHAPIRLPHGVLLYGPPGCGKTLLARTAAVESRMRCVLVKGPELLSKYIGESEAEVRRAFEKAASCTPCVLLFDEFDSLAPRRGGESTGVADRVVNTLLTCMDGAERLSEGVHVIATTSRPELIDPALLRPGRLDKWIAIDIPWRAQERLEILTCLYPKFFSSTPDINATLGLLAERTKGYTGADLGAILNDSHLSYTKLKRKKDEKQENPNVAELLKQALRESRPSLSRLQREYFQHVMSRFNGEEPSSERDSNHVGAENGSRYGNRVALQ